MGHLVYLLIFSLVFFIHGCSKTKSKAHTSLVTVKGSVNVKGASIYINSIDSQGKLIKRIEVKVEGTQFSTKVPYSERGGFLVFVADGGVDYIRATKTIKYKARKDIDNINVSLELLKVNKIKINVKDGLTITDDGRKYLRIKLGDIKAMSGNTSKVIDLSVPLYAFQQITDTVEVRYRSFEPSNSADYRFFPGEEDENGNRLVSVGFDYIEIVDVVSGESVFEGVEVKQGDEYLRMLRWVDKIQLSKIRRGKGSVDEDSNRGGIQVTFYAFDSNKGRWVVAGQGVFVKNSSINYTSSTFDNILRNGCANKQECDNNSVFWDETEMFNAQEIYAVVSITNPDLRWKNLDYIVPGDPVECTVIIKDEKGNPIGTFVEAVPYGDNNIEYTYGYTSPSDGRAILSTVAFGSPANAMIYYQNPRLNWIIEGMCEEANSYVVAFGENCVCTINTGDIEVCTVKGNVTDSNGNPVSNAFISIKNGGFFTFTFTDNQGNYSAQVPCNKDLTIYVDYSYGPYNFNVNGVINDKESSDDGTTSVVDINLEDCYVEGTIYYNENPLEGVRVNTIYDSGVITTDEQGGYNLRVQCNKSESIYIFKDKNIGPCNCKISVALNINVNGEIEDNEDSDNGRIAVVNFDLAPCFVSGKFADNNILNGTLNSASVKAGTTYDPQTNFIFYISQGTTDNQGNFSLPIICNHEFILTADYLSYANAYINISYRDSYRVDGVKNNNEESDNETYLSIGTINTSQCTVTGNVTDNNNSALSNVSIKVTTNGSYSVCNNYPCLIYNVYTYSTGNYAAGALCEIMGEVRVLYKTCDKNPKYFNVNSQGDQDETEDSGDQVTVNFSNCQ